ncbi:AAA domain-containing protein [Nitrospirillum sp. BR 11164]|uniref:AAA domain-containing protein n=1 Tax=Nitrospirillum sp. BR 11164 TaxID=3104324 RepID=UPI002AFE313B|nr:AAA domain-containing protein [Nitrospirillum sp. BR 11164]MEA1653019.1 AAA domain-containing protein [Nitrospirillum sp. BR 11164]
MPTADTLSVSILRYWRQCLKEGLLRSPDMAGAQSIDAEAVTQGQLPSAVVEALYNLLRDARAPSTTGPGRKRSTKGDAPNAALEDGERYPIPVIVAPYSISPVSGRSREADGDGLPLYWVPATLNPDGRLVADAAHLPFIPRPLLDPPVGDRAGAWPPPVAVYDEYDAIIRDQVVNREDSWSARLTYAEEMFTDVAGESASHWMPDGWQRERPLVLAWDRNTAFIKQLLPLYDAWLKTDPPPGALARIVAGHPNPAPLPVPADTPRLGHSGGRPLNAKQRDTVAAAALLQEGQVLAVNGPPGTGKTSLLKSLIADTVVRAAVSGAEPPRIAITSTNNQAVLNAATDIGKSGPASSTEGRRWLPQIDEWVAYVPSENAKSKAKDTLILDDLRVRMFAKPYQEEARTYFLARFADWRRESNDHSAAPGPEQDEVETACALLIKALKEVVSTIEQQTRRKEAVDRWLAARPEHAQRVAALMTDETAAMAELAQLTTQRQADVARLQEVMREHDNAINTLRYRASLHPWWMKLFSFVPSIDAARAGLLRQSAISLAILPPETSALPTQMSVFIKVDAHFQTRRQGTLPADAEAVVKARIDALRLERSGLERGYAEDQQLAEDLGIWVGVPADGAGFETAFQSRMDTVLRSRAFDLALRLREGQFLQRAQEWDEAWTGDRGYKGRATRPLFLTACAYVIPCIVGTVYKVAQHNCYYGGDRDGTQPLTLPIDLLIYDEAGQVAPDLGLGLLGLARRAVAVGDVHQLQPVESFSEASDSQLMDAAGITDAQQISCRRQGLNHAGGSVMAAVQAATAFGDIDTQVPGILLREHFRCVPKIIGYCNDLVYKRLVCMKPEEADPWIAPMSWAHVRGQARRMGKSWTNPVEAEAIADWLARHWSTLEARYGGAPEERVAVLTPFGSQSRVLRQALEKHLGADAAAVTVGTVHTLQGMERHLVVFSPTVTLASSNGNRPFFDRGVHMLNVAVSRAKNAFAVIGDMALFDATAGHAPSSVLARHLYRDPENELTDVRPALAYTSPAGETERVDGIEQHRALLVEAFRAAQERLLVSSPFLTQAAITADQVLDLVKSATNGGVEVTIYTGLPTSQETSGAIDTAPLRTALAEAGATVMVTTKVHAKTLAADDALLVEGSFNWLSASRNPNYSRKETSLALRGALVRRHTETLWEEFEALKAKQWSPA